MSYVSYSMPAPLVALKKLCCDEHTRANRKERKIASGVLLTTALALTVLGIRYFLKGSFPAFFNTDTRRIFTAFYPETASFNSGTTELVKGVKALYYSKGLSEDTPFLINNLTLAIFGYIATSWGMQIKIFPYLKEFCFDIIDVGTTKIQKSLFSLKKSTPEGT